MHLILSKKYDLAFVSYLWKLVKLRSLNSLNAEKLKAFSEEFGFNYLNAIEFAFNNSRVSETEEYRLVSFSNYAKYHDISCSKIIDTLTYGTRSIKGVSTIKDIFEDVNNNVDSLYRGWLHVN